MINRLCRSNAFIPINCDRNCCLNKIQIKKKDLLICLFFSLNKPISIFSSRWSTSKCNFVCEIITFTSKDSGKFIEKFLFFFFSFISFYFLSSLSVLSNSEFKSETSSICVKSAILAILSKINLKFTRLIEID